MQLEIARVSTKGQVVIPGRIRRRLGLGAGSKLMVATDGRNVLMKPILPPRLDAFRELAEKTRKAARRAGLKPSDVTQAVAEARDARRR